MGPQQALALVQQYREFFAQKGIVPAEASMSNNLVVLGTALPHCASMLPLMERMVQDGEMGKFFRWLGFLQGVLWTLGIYSLDEMRKHNRPNAPE